MIRSLCSELNLSGKKSDIYAIIFRFDETKKKNLSRQNWRLKTYQVHFKTQTLLTYNLRNYLTTEK